MHFCLASNPSSEFEEKLPNWEFYLDFEINGKTYTSSRNTNTQKDICLGEETLSLDKFRKTLEKILFRIPENVKFITFRSLMTRFIRPRKGSYTWYDTFVEEENDITKLVNNSFLLGLDIHRIINKYILKEDHDKIKELKAKIEKDKILKSFFQDGRDEDVESKQVTFERKINKLKNSITSFQIAEDYYQIKKDADEISFRLKEQRNHSAKLRIAIHNIERSLQIRPDISKVKVESLFSEAKIVLPETVTKRLDDLEAFNQKLIQSRNKQLLDEKYKFAEELLKNEEKVEALGKLLNQKLEYLNSHGALDDYAKLNQELSDTEKQLDKIVQYKKLLKEYRDRFERIKQQFSEENISTNQYLYEAENIIKEDITLFQSFTEEFYSEKFSGITVENNEGVNQTRFDIKAKIQDDAGDAVNEVKIFCFDWTLLKAQHNHSVKFLFHDSRITDGMDPRQISTIFKIANRECKENNFQYVISLNQNVINDVKAEINNGEEFNALIGNNIKLELSDKSPEEKLLGVQIDLTYQ